MESSVSNSTPTAEKPVLSDEDRAERLARLAERIVSPDGLDHDAIANIERLTGAEQ